MFCFVTPRRLSTALAPLGLAACTGLSPQPTALLDYQPETFSGGAHVHHFAAAPSRTCEAARRALLSQGYVVHAAQADQVSGRKYFQPNAEHHVQLEFRVVCAAEAGDGDGTLAFVSGLQDQYVVRKVKESASLGVGGIGSLSLPVEGGMDSMVKIASETLSDQVLYQRFFGLVGDYLTRTDAPDAPASSSMPSSAPAT
ncbi:DUF2242 domain-containing protein [Ottowia sp.]|uniref:DUF2242 domain-containing protein n=1 Tax=Ottowia sp. TaxID=1898956 RepID=UPI002C7ADD6A|nr:DUF2242 domain-containing protein [Ottowia sp.]HOB67418.1 DUF2242 domain-containing protein [Ottowia sp.]HPZ57546.1 DUF2242 domain-containing protein [Ottowia sp.]HQD46968.1 DUF2242 domain-containing protein [Ottowia sp.]